MHGTGAGALDPGSKGSRRRERRGGPRHHIQVLRQEQKGLNSWAGVVTWGESGLGKDSASGAGEASKRIVQQEGRNRHS